MACGSCGFGADFLTSCHHMFCFACFSNYINHNPDYPIKCLCCNKILTPKECLENLFGEDKEVFKRIRENFLSFPPKNPSSRVSLEIPNEGSPVVEKEVMEFDDIVSEQSYYESDKELNKPIKPTNSSIKNNTSIRSIHSNASIRSIRDNLAIRSIKDKSSIRSFKSNNSLMRSIKRAATRIPIKYQGKYACVGESEIYKFKDPVCERVTCPNCQEIHTTEETCEEWKERNADLLLERNKIKVEPHIVSYAKFMKEYGRLTEDELLEKCKFLGFMPIRRVCPKTICGRELRPSTHTGKPIWRCTRCRSTASMRQNTWFYKSWMGYFDILQLTFCWVMGVGQDMASEITGHKRNTVVDWFKKCRRHTIDIIENTSWRIGGPNIHVEVDSIMLGRARIVKGGRRAPHMYLGLLEQGNVRSLIVLPIADCTSENLESIITRWVLPGSIIHTDEWFGVSNLRNLGYVHIVNRTSFDESSEAMESIWEFVRSGCPPKGSKRKYMTSYIMAKIWRRRNECLYPMDKFEQFMRATLDCACTKMKKWQH